MCLGGNMLPFNLLSWWLLNDRGELRVGKNWQVTKLGGKKQGSANLENTAHELNNTRDFERMNQAA